MDRSWSFDKGGIFKSESEASLKAVDVPGAPLALGTVTLTQLPPNHALTAYNDKLLANLLPLLSRNRVQSAIAELTGFWAALIAA